VNQRRHGRGRGPRVLWAVIFLALVYLGLLYFLHTLTGDNVLDGIIGVVVGLYICSLPAANAVDLIFAERSASLQFSSLRTGGRWLALNLLTLLAGWIVIVVGAIRLFG
jgi:hypothetical protein